MASERKPGQGRGRTRQTVDAKRVALAELEAEALRLKIGGASYRRIAEHQGISNSTAHERVKAALAEITLEPATELKAIEDERLSALLAALWPTAMREGPRQVEACRECRRIIERRAKLHGLDAPTRVRREVVTAEDLEDALNELDDSIARMEAGEPVQP
jgi:hypothetical protein